VGLTVLFGEKERVHPRSRLATGAPRALASRDIVPDRVSDAKLSHLGAESQAIIACYGDFADLREALSAPLSTIETALRILEVWIHRVP
jgi:hypothetical protein